MSELISGKDALIALANGEVVEMTDSEVDMPWTEICVKNNDFFGKVEPCPWMFINTPNHIQFRLKPQTIKINGIEVPKPDYIVDTPHDYDGCWEINISGTYYLFKTEQNYKQVVDALRSVFNG